MKISSIVSLMIASILVFAGCSGSAVSVEDAEKAYLVGFATVMAASLGAAFGDAPEGVTLSEDKLTMTLDKYDISRFEKVDYTEVSGKVVREGDVMKCDLKFTGGPVKTMQFDLGDLGDMSHIQTTIKVNGKDVDIDITSDEIDAMEGS